MRGSQLLYGLVASGCEPGSPEADPESGGFDTGLRPEDPLPAAGVHAIQAPSCGSNQAWADRERPLFAGAPVRTDAPSLLLACPDSSPEAIDVDRDGLPDRWEVDLGADPRRPDTDGDGLGDGLDWVFGSPVDPDPDGDGLLDSAEVAFGAEVDRIDTDCDGAVDGRDVAFGASPRVADTDGDGLLDGQEIEAGWSPTEPGAGDDAGAERGGWVALVEPLAGWDDPGGPTPARFVDRGPVASGTGRAVDFDGPLRSDVALDAGYVRLFREYDGVWQEAGSITRFGWADTGTATRGAVGFGHTLAGPTLLPDRGARRPAPRSPPRPRSRCDEPLTGAWQSPEGTLLFATAPHTGELRVAFRSAHPDLIDLHLVCGDVAPYEGPTEDHWEGGYAGRRVLCTQADRRPARENEVVTSWLLDVYASDEQRLLGLVCLEGQSSSHYQEPGQRCAPRVLLEATRPRA
jgi:hypothetical protein